MLWPGPDTRSSHWPGPDDRPPLRWPLADERRADFPPVPVFAVELAVDAVGGGVASVALVVVPVVPLAAVGGGVAEVAVEAAAVGTVDAVGGGVASVVFVGDEIYADAVGGGVASVAVVPSVATEAPATGGGDASAAVVPVAVGTVAAVGGGVASAEVTATPVYPIDAVGGGVASAAVVPVGVGTIAAVGGGTAGAAISVGYSYADNFNRTDSASLGADWRVDRNGSPRIATNRAMMKTMSGGGRQGCWASWQSGTFATDNYSVEVQFIAPVGNLASDNMTGAILAVGDTFGAGVMCYFVATTANGVAIYTQSGLPPTTGISTGQTGQTQRAVTATSASTSDLFRFERVGNVFTLYRNGSSFLTWTDTGNLVSSGPTFRRWGIFFEGNTVVFPAAHYNSPAIDAVTEARDV